MNTYLAASVTSTQIQEIVQPILDLIDVTVPILIMLIGSIGMIWCIVLGVKYAQASEPQEHEKAKSALKNAIIGFVLIFVLLAMIDIGVEVFSNYWQSYTV